MAASSKPINRNLLINTKSKWYTELFEICSQGYSVRGNSTFPVNLDVMIQCKPKQIVCLINGCDLLFEWKRKQQIERIKSVSKYFKHSYVMIIIKHDLELQRINKLFNSDKYFEDILEINIELIYFQDLNEATRFFGNIASKTSKFSKNSKNNKNKNGPNDENKENDQGINSYLDDNNNRIIDILQSINDLNEDDALNILNSHHSLTSIQGIANQTINDMNSTLSLHRQQIRSIYQTFHQRQQNV